MSREVPEGQVLTIGVWVMENYFDCRYICRITFIGIWYLGRGLILITENIFHWLIIFLENNSSRISVSVDIVREQEEQEKTWNREDIWKKE
jgi:hypothetical protein